MSDIKFSLLQVIFTLPLVLGNLELSSDVNKFIEAVMKCRKIPGLNLAVVHGSKSFTGGFGLANLETKRPVDKDTLFCIGSISKSFTVALLEDLMTDDKLRIGKCDWNTKLRDIIDDFESSDPWRTAEMTLKDILSHRTGLENINLYYFVGHPTDFTRKDLMRRLKYLKEIHPFRDKFNYNNVMYTLAGYVAEVIGNNTWERLIEERVFKKAGMTSSSGIFDSNLTNLSTPYIYDAMTEKYNNVLNISRSTSIESESAGGIISNAQDMSKWMTYLLEKVNTCYLKAVEPIQVSSDAGMFLKDMAPGLDFDYNVHAYGMGWYIGSYRGYKMYTHSGDLYGYLSNIILIPELNLGIFASTNGPGGLPAYIGLSHITFYIIDELILKIEPFVNKSTSCNSFEFGKEDKPIDKTLLPVPNPADYMGIFGHQIIGDLEIGYSEENHTLVCSLGINLKGRLYNVNNTNSFIVSVDAPLYSLKEFKFGSLMFTFHDRKENLEYGKVTVGMEQSFHTFDREVRFGNINSAPSISLTCNLEILLIFVVVMMFVEITN